MNVIVIIAWVVFVSSVTRWMNALVKAYTMPQEEYMGLTENHECSATCKEDCAIQKSAQFVGGKVMWRLSLALATFLGLLEMALIFTVTMWVTNHA